jgi:hypothetical protein
MIESMHTELVVLTRDGCVNTPEMLKKLDEALRGLRIEPGYPLVNVAALRPGDPRAAYPTPTVLVGSRDLFGMPEPVPPFPESA